MEDDEDAFYLSGVARHVPHPSTRDQLARQFAGERSGQALPAPGGGAIIALSDPDDEYEETAVKATALLRPFRQDFPERSAPGGHEQVRLRGPRAQIVLAKGDAPGG